MLQRSAIAAEHLWCLEPWGLPSDRSIRTHTWGHVTPRALCAMLAVHLQVFIGSFRGRAGSKANLKADRRPPSSMQSSLHSNQTAWEASEGPASAPAGSTAGEAESCLGPQLDARLLKAMSIELTGACSSSSVLVQCLPNGLMSMSTARLCLSVLDRSTACSDRGLAVCKQQVIWHTTVA